MPTGHRATCKHFTPTGRISARAGCFDPLLPESVQGLCRQCLGPALIKHRIKQLAIVHARQAEKVLHEQFGELVKYGRFAEPLIPVFEAMAARVRISLSLRSLKGVRVQTWLGKKETRVSEGAKQHGENSPLES